jgi:hypothetical protein
MLNGLAACCVTELKEKQKQPYLCAVHRVKMGRDRCKAKNTAAFGIKVRRRRRH